MSDTPRTDVKQFSWLDSRNQGHWLVESEFARELERELVAETKLRQMYFEQRNAAEDKLELELAREGCSQCGASWSPSLIESGWCIFCIQKDTKKKLEEALLRATCKLKD